MNISIKELFASAKPKLIPEDISWEGNTATVYFRRLTMEEGLDIARPYLNANSNGIDREKFKNYQAALVATVVRDADGTKVVDEADVLNSDGEFYRLIIAAAEKHNPTAQSSVEEIAKNSETTTSNAAS